MSKLKMRVVLFEKAIAAQILEQDERSRKYFEWDASNEFCIKSDGSLELGNDEIYLRGNADDLDSNIGHKRFSSNKERDEYVSKMNFALKEWSEKWEGWKEEKKVSEEIDTALDQVWEF